MSTRIKIKTRLTLALSCYFSLQALTVNAETVAFSQLPTAYNAILSDVDTSYHAADDFTLLTDASISKITWRGAYSDSIGLPAGNSFLINFYKRDYTPDASALQLLSTDLIHSIALDTSVQRTNTGTTLQVAPFSVYEYTADLGSALELSAGTYWLSIVSADETTRNWYWAFGTGGNSLLSTNGGITFGDTAAQGYSDNYFALSQVPVPGAVLFFASGLISLAGVSGYRKNRGR